MKERRIEGRLLCADLVEIEWSDRSRRTHRAVVNLEDISVSGASLQTEQPLEIGSAIRILMQDKHMLACVKYCIHREIGYFAGVIFMGAKWSRQRYRPKHLLDPRWLARTDSADSTISPVE
jgi:hypothetical protein